MSFRKLTLVFAVIFLAAPASAQVNTNCSLFGNTMSCETREARDPNADANALGAIIGSIARENREKKQRQAAIEAENARLAQQRAYADQQSYAVGQEQAFMAIVSQAVQAGECEDAKAIALSRSRLDIADQAARICTPKRKPSAPRKGK